MSFSLSVSGIGKDSLGFSTGELAKQAQGSVTLVYGETVVLTTVCMSKDPSSYQGMLPLLVDYQEKTYAIGKIPGGFIKKEGRPKDAEILSSRLIDRTLRPLFPSGFLNEIQIVSMVLSSDAKNDPDVLAINGASCALFISEIPFYNPLGAVRVSKLENEFIINPTYEERFRSTMDLVVAGREGTIVMLEGMFDGASEEDVLAAIKFAHPFICQIISAQKEMREKAGVRKKDIPLFKINEDLYKLIKDKVYSQFEGIYVLIKKEDREDAVGNLLRSVTTLVLEKKPEISTEEIKNCFFNIEEEFVRKKILDESKRPDGRSLEDIRPIECKVRMLPRTHGSALFTRGQTQSLSVVTLGTSSDEQRIEALEGTQSKHFMLHYLFPPFSVGEIKPLRGPSRREIGHGALAEKAVLNVIPSKEVFPYTIRVVSEILESNGSSSMATVCASSLALMDAGVPISFPVAGIAMGLVTGDNRYKILTDIAGVEDYYGDMDFKIAGTSRGITAIQLDIKLDGINYSIINDALLQAKEARRLILDKMNEALSLPREMVSKYAPKIKSFKIDPDKIGSIIGPGGSIIRRMTRENNVSIDIDDEMSSVSVVAETEDDLDKTIQQIMCLTKEIEVDQIYEVKVTRLINFGAFCEICPGKSGLIHISELSGDFVRDVKDVVKEGDILKAKVISIDPQGRINLSAKRAQ